MLEGAETLDLPLSRAFFKKTLYKALQPLHKDISDIKTEVKQIGGRIMALEETQAAIVTHGEAVRKVLQGHNSSITSALLHLEDQENRSRRKNVQIRGVPEDVPPGEITNAVTAIFASLVGEEKASQIIIERAHRALRPKPSENGPPRDIICGLLNYLDTAAILKAARETNDVTYNGARLQFYQDLASSTLAKRRALKPVTEALRLHKLPVRWLFPFGLAASKAGQQIVIRSPQDLADAWDKLGIAPVEVQPWMPVPENLGIPNLPEIPTWQVVKKPKSPKNRKDT